MKKRLLLTSLLSLFFLCGCNQPSDTSVPTSGIEQQDSVPTHESDSSSVVSTSEAVDYGTISFPSCNVLIGYANLIRPSFSKPEMAEDLEYDMEDESIAYIEGNTVTGLNVGSTKVRAHSEHFEGEFYIRVFQNHTNNPSYFEAKVKRRKEVFENKGLPEENLTLFCGDSFFDTDEFWTNFYSEYYGKENCFNMGISATTADDWYYYAQKLIIPYNPVNVVIHIGTNDINDNKTSAFVTEDRLQTLVEEIHENCPDTRIYLLGIEASTLFAGNLNTELETNRQTKAYCEANASYLTYVDSPSLIALDDTGKANGSLLRSDGLHLLLTTYELYADLLAESGLTTTPLPVEEKEGFVAPNGGLAGSYETNTFSLDASSTSSQCVTNRNFFTKKDQETYSGDLTMSGTISVTQGHDNHFSELYVGETLTNWSDGHCFQFLIFNGTPVIWGSGNQIVKTFSTSTSYSFNLEVKGHAITFKLNEETYTTSLTAGSLKTSFSAENEKVTVSSLSIKTN